jgi:hypothetical protein
LEWGFKCDLFSLICWGDKWLQNEED